MRVMGSKGLGRSMGRVLLPGVTLLALACDPPPVKPEPPPPPVVAVVAPEPPPPPQETFEAEVLDGEPTEGLPDDPGLATGTLTDASLQDLLLRDPDKALRVLEQAPGPTAFRVSILAALALKRGVDGPRLEARELPLPEVPASGTLASTPGPAFVGTTFAEVRTAPGKGKLLASLPIGTAVTIDAVQGKRCSVTFGLATRVDFAPTGATPLNVTTATFHGVLPLSALVTTPPQPQALVTEASNQPTTEAGRDVALVLRHRVWLLAPSEATRRKVLEAAWTARRPSWVAQATLEKVWAAPKGLRLAWGCRGELAKASWGPMKKGPPPANACFTGVDVRVPCAGQVPAVLEQRRHALEKAGVSEPSPRLSFSVDATRLRRVHLASVPLRLPNECEGGDELKLDTYGATLRRLPLPLGVASMVVTVPVRGWHGMEHSVVGAQSEAKARDWLRARATSRWTLDARGEPSPSLGVGDLGFALERDVVASSLGVAPQVNCELCGGSDSR